jgi:hypothetical protein
VNGADKGHAADLKTLAPASLGPWEVEHPIKRGDHLSHSCEGAEGRRTGCGVEMKARSLWVARLNKISVWRAELVGDSGFGDRSKGFWETCFGAGRFFSQTGRHPGRIAGRQARERKSAGVVQRRGHQCWRRRREPRSVTRVTY